MSLALEWTGQQAFVSQPLRNWTVEDKVAGVTRSAGSFTFATVAGAGHMVRNLYNLKHRKPLNVSYPGPLR